MLRQKHSNGRGQYGRRECFYLAKYYYFFSRVCGVPHMRKRPIAVYYNSWVDLTYRMPTYNRAKQNVHFTAIRRDYKLQYYYYHRGRDV